jgi:ABC-type antimicrobial peptide transport system permease subunit
VKVDKKVDIPIGKQFVATLGSWFDEGSVAMFLGWADKARDIAVMDGTRQGFRSEGIAVTFAGYFVEVGP